MAQKSTAQKMVMKIMLQSVIAIDIINATAYTGILHRIIGLCIISFILSAADSLNVTLMNHLLTNNINVNITLEWPRKAGVVYSVFILPETSAVFAEVMSHDRLIINITIPYNILNNVTITADLCGQHSVTTTKVLNYGMQNSRWIMLIIIILC